ncbi:MAG: glycosyltransferase [Candidatus Aenigmarchaeota archaeon]|nr:glycosyltransferase [Candidatus Aenigmarchaeota archaeon]
MDVSVIVPAYNSRHTISECLRALQSQNCQHSYEIIVVDDGSNDGTVGVARRSIRNIVKQPHCGPAAARNHGAKQAHGSLLLFTDADCTPAPDWITEMVKPFKDKSVVGVQGVYKTRQTSLLARFAQLEIEDRYDRMARKKIDFLSTYSAAYRRSAFLNSGGFDEGFTDSSGEDADLSFRLTGSGSKMVFNTAAAVYHQHPDTLTKYLRQKYSRAYWRVRLYRKHTGKMISESYTPQSLKLQIALFCLLPVLVIYPIIPHLWTIPTALIFALSLPLTVKNLRKDVIVGFATPFLLFLRTAVFTLGLIAGLLPWRRKR